MHYDFYAIAFLKFRLKIFMWEQQLNQYSVSDNAE